MWRVKAKPRDQAKLVLRPSGSHHLRRKPIGAPPIQAHARPMGHGISDFRSAVQHFLRAHLKFPVQAAMKDVVHACYVDHGRALNGERNRGQSRFRSLDSERGPNRLWQRGIDKST